MRSTVKKFLDVLVLLFAAFIFACVVWSSQPSEEEYLPPKVDFNEAVQVYHAQV